MPFLNDREEIKALEAELELDRQKDGKSAKQYLLELQAADPYQDTILRKNAPLGIHHATYKLNDRLTPERKEQIQTKLKQLRQSRAIAETKDFLDDPILTTEQKQQVLLNALLDGAYMCKPANKAAVEATFKLLKEIDHPKGNGIKWADVLADALPGAAILKANALAEQLKKEDKYDKKWFWRISDPNKLIKAAALENVATKLKPRALTVDGSDYKAGDAVPTQNKVEAVTDPAVTAGAGRGVFTSMGSGTGSRTNDLLSAIKQAVEGLYRPSAPKAAGIQVPGAASGSASLSATPAIPILDHTIPSQRRYYY